MKKLTFCLCMGFLMACFMAVSVGAESVMEVSDDGVVEDSNAEPDTDSVSTMEALEEEESLEPEPDAEESNWKIKEKNKKRKATYKESDLRLMSCLIFCEAGGEPYAGKKAVGIVVMNRVKSKGYPNTVKGVLYQKHQFGPVRNGMLKRTLAKWDAGKFRGRAARECVKAAKEALGGDTKVQVKNGKTKNMSKFRFFSGYLRKARYRIGSHLFR